MTQGKDNFNRIASVGGYQIQETSDGYKLGLLDRASTEYPDAGAFVFGNETQAADVARLLSLAFQRGTSTSSIKYKIGDRGLYEVSGGELGFCRLYRLNKKSQEEPFLVAESSEDLLEGLKIFFKSQNAD